MADTVAITRLGPQHDGMRMTLREFKEIEFEPGYIFELARGVVVVAELPNVFHMLVVLAIRNAIIKYQLEYPGRVFAVAGGGESGVEMPAMDSRRHPDISAYLTPPPTSDAQPWDTWIPEIAIEVVSESSRKRDFDDKPDDYLAAGVKQYWIIDPARKNATLLTRAADNTWKRANIDASGTISTGLLPGFSLVLDDVLAVVKQ